MTTAQPELALITLDSNHDALVDLFMDVIKAEFILSERVSLHADVEEMGIIDDFYLKTVQDVTIAKEEAQTARERLSKALSEIDFA